MTTTKRMTNVCIAKTMITGKEHCLYDRIMEIYADSFPVFEQRTEAGMEYAFGHSAYRLTAYTDTEGHLLGFISYWEFASYLYIEHLAIVPTMRGKGMGSRMLTDFTTGNNGKKHILEIDPPTDETARARQRFYEHCGFKPCPYPHRHPPYRDGYGCHKLVVMSHPEALTEEEYALFRQDLSETVMQTG